MFEKNLKNIRTKSGYSQKYVADYLNISPQSVSKWENGDALPSILFLPKLAECFGCDINDFFAVADVSNYDLKMLKEFLDLIITLNNDSDTDGILDNLIQFFDCYTDIEDVIDKLYNDFKQYQCIKDKTIQAILGCTSDEAVKFRNKFVEFELIEKLDSGDSYFVIKDGFKGLQRILFAWTKLIDVMKEKATDNN